MPISWQTSRRAGAFLSSWCVAWFSNEIGGTHVKLVIQKSDVLIWLMICNAYVVNVGLVPSRCLAVIVWTPSGCSTKHLTSSWKARLELSGLSCLQAERRDLLSRGLDRRYHTRGREAFLFHKFEMRVGFWKIWIFEDSTWITCFPLPEGKNWIILHLSNFLFHI